jgi:hypothetical protein
MATRSAQAERVSRTAAARSDEDVSCLIRELAVYGPKRSRRTVLIELEERSQSDFLALLTAVETCLSANGI